MKTMKLVVQVNKSEDVYENHPTLLEAEKLGIHVVENVNSVEDILRSPNLNQLDDFLNNHNFSIKTLYNLIGYDEVRSFIRDSWVLEPDDENFNEILNEYRENGRKLLEDYVAYGYDKILIDMILEKLGFVDYRHHNDSTSYIILSPTDLINSKPFEGVRLWLDGEGFYDLMMDVLDENGYVVNIGEIDKVFAPDLSIIGELAINWFETTVGANMPYEKWLDIERSDIDELPDFRSGRRG